MYLGSCDKVSSSKLNSIVVARATYLSKVLCVAMESYDISILACTLCGVLEINWNRTSNFGSAGYVCSKCLDLHCHERHRAIFLTLYRQIYKALPQVCTTYIYNFIHPTNHSQWKYLIGTTIRSAGWQCNYSWVARRAPTTTSTTYINNCSKADANYSGKVKDTAPAAGTPTLIFMSCSALISSNRTHVEECFLRSCAQIKCG